MSLSPGVWISVFPSPAVPQGSGCGTVLMSVRVSVSRGTLRTLRPLRSPAAVEDDAALRLQLSMDPNRPGDFRLTLRDSGSNGRIMVSHLALVERSDFMYMYISKVTLLIYLFIYLYV